MADINLNDALNVAKRQMVLEAKHTNDSLLYASVSNAQLAKRNFLEFSEEMIKRINRTHHATGVPIGFVLRFLVLPKPHADDPERTTSPTTMRHMPT